VRCDSSGGSLHFRLLLVMLSLASHLQAGQGQRRKHEAARDEKAGLAVHLMEHAHQVLLLLQRVRHTQHLTACARLLVGGGVSCSATQGLSQLLEPVTWAASARAAAVAP
jgi:tRNA A37 threonylcarbamoyltransferase TsaD